MATIVFKCNDISSKQGSYPRLTFYHGNDVKIEFASYDWWETYKRFKPCDERYARWFSVPDIQDLPDKNTFPNHPSFDIACRTIEPSSECKYNPMYINGWYDTVGEKDTLSSQGYDDYQKLIADTLGIPTIDELFRIAQRSGYKWFVVKRNVDIRIAYVKHFCGFRNSVLVVGEPKKLPYEVRWIKRFDSEWVNGADVKKYRKVIKTFRWAGENGLALIDIAHLGPDLSYPDFYGEMREKLFGNETTWIDYSKPSVYSEATKQTMRLAEERKRKEREKLEWQKTQPGYCDKCGQPHAQFIQDPWRGISGWFCCSCYNDEYGYDD